MQQDRHAYDLEREERRQARRDRLELAAGMSSFLAVILGIALILILLLLILSLITWLRNDIASTFTLLGSRF